MYSKYAITKKGFLGLLDLGPWTLKEILQLPKLYYQEELLSGKMSKKEVEELTDSIEVKNGILYYDGEDIGFEYKYYLVVYGSPLDIFPAESDADAVDLVWNNINVMLSEDDVYDVFFVGVESDISCFLHNLTGNDIASIYKQIGEEIEIYLIPEKVNHEEAVEVEIAYKRGELKLIS